MKKKYKLEFKKKVVRDLEPNEIEDVSGGFITSVLLCATTVCATVFCPPSSDCINTTPTVGSCSSETNC